MEKLVLEDLSDLEEERCPHSKIVPYGDGKWGRCVRCGDASFPLVAEDDPEVPSEGLVMVLYPEDRDALLDRLRARLKKPSL
jgi:hypothetical protein